MSKRAKCFVMFVTISLLYHATRVDGGRATSQILKKLSEIENKLCDKIDSLSNITKEQEKRKEFPTCPVQTCYPVCQSGEMCVNLDETGAVIGYLPGVNFTSSVTSPVNGKPCSRQAVLKVQFLKDKSLEPCVPDDALNIKLFPQSLLKIQMYFSNGERSGFMFNIGDSHTNNGYSGDSGTQSNDAEVQGLAKNITVYGNDGCPTQPLHNYVDALKHPVSMVNFWIRNKHMKVTNDYGLFESGCNNCLFALNGQQDAEGPENEEIYIGANRVILSNTRAGVGLCFMKLRWVSSTNQ